MIHIIEIFLWLETDMIIRNNVLGNSYNKYPTYYALV